jgi:hypothetical protein
MLPGTALRIGLGRDRVHGFEDRRRHGFGAGSAERVERAGHLVYALGPGSIGHEAVQGGRNVEVSAAEGKPGRGRPPRRDVCRPPGGAGDPGDRALGTAHYGVLDGEQLGDHHAGLNIVGHLAGSPPARTGMGFGGGVGGLASCWSEDVVPHASRDSSPWAWVRRNCRQPVSAPRGAGGVRVRARIRRIVPAPTRWPRPRSSPWSLRWPQPGFSCANCRTRSRTSAVTGGRPGRRGQVQ